MAITHSRPGTPSGSSDHRAECAPRLLTLALVPIANNQGGALPIIKEAQKAGATSLRAVAEALNARGISTARGGAWHAMSVKNVLDRPTAHKSQLGER
jgi:hypothetical protein